MKCAFRGNVIMTLVGMLSFFAVLACSAGNPRDVAERRGAVLHDEGSRRTHDERSIQDRAELARQYNTIIESLRLIQKAVESCSR